MSSSVELPAGLVPYRRTGDFTEATIPKGLLSAHSTKEGVWGLIHVLEGRLRYSIEDARREPSETELTPTTPPGVVEPTIVHSVSPVEAVRFFVEFYRAV